LAAALLGLLAFSSAAKACSYPDAEQVFAPWGDSQYYQLAPDGGLEEGGSGWTLEGGAELVAGNEAYFLNDPTDATSLRIPYGGLATSPKFCVDADTPVFRFMALNAGDRSKLSVTVTYELPSKTRVRNNEIRASGEWAPTDPQKLEINGDTERVARISFTPRDAAGDWLIDDLYIDPFARH